MGMSPPREFTDPDRPSSKTEGSHASSAAADGNEESPEVPQNPSRDPKSRQKIIKFQLKTRRRPALPHPTGAVQGREGSSHHSQRSRRSSGMSETVVAVDIQPVQPAKALTQAMV